MRILDTYIQKAQINGEKIGKCPGMVREFDDEKLVDTLYIHLLSSR